MEPSVRGSSGRAMKLQKEKDRERQKKLRRLKASRGVKGMLLGCTVWPEIFARRKFSPPACMDEIFIPQISILSHIDDYTEDMVTFTALAKIYFIPANISAMQG